MNKEVNIAITLKQIYDECSYEWEYKAEATSCFYGSFIQYSKNPVTALRNVIDLLILAGIESREECYIEQEGDLSLDSFFNNTEE